MPPWYFSWLPSLPSIDFTLPSGIQRRFISFVLQKLLGNLVKPGQLDANQIDSQIGSGFVQVRDLELDSEAINEALSGLPIQLHEGTISSVTARIPWPNPLVSTLGLSLQSVHLTFYVNSIPRRSPAVPISNLADSVASVAESFIHDELTPHEEASLRESFHPDLTSFEGLHNVPGGLDPFLSVPDEEEFQSDIDPTGVSIFATLIERLLARFEFDASDTRITLVHPGCASFTLSVRELLYRTEDGKVGDQMAEHQNGQVRTISVSDVNITAQNLRPTTYTVSPRPSLYVNTPSPRSVSPASSSSSMDEGTQFLMSQSLVSLPPRSPSPENSVSSSMYHSAVSTVDPGTPIAESRTLSPGRRHTEHPRLETPRAQGQESEMILSFGIDPLTIRLTTPPPSPAPPPPSYSSAARVPVPKDKESDKLQLTVSVGVIAIALRARQIRNILELLDIWFSHYQLLPASREDHASSKSAPPLTPTMDVGIEGSLNLRGVVLLVLPSESWLRELRENYFSRPLVPPRAPHGYVRMHLEALSFSFSSGTATANASSTGAPGDSGSPTTGPMGNATTLTFSLFIGEISIFAFHKVTQLLSNEETDLTASPILITDYQLPLQYSSVHAYPNLQSRLELELGPGESSPGLPAFELVDWTTDANRSSSAKPSTWRARVKSHGSRRPTSAVPPSNTPAISISGTKRISTSSSTSTRKTKEIVRVNVLPLQMFVDLNLVLCSRDVLLFLEEAVPLDDGTHGHKSTRPDDYGDSISDGGDTPPATPHSSNAEGVAKVQRKSENLMECPGLDLDNRANVGQNLGSSRARKQSNQKIRMRGQERTTTVIIALPLVRLQIRCPSPLSKSQRSGALVVDFHDILLSNESPSYLNPAARFEDHQSRSNNFMLGVVECRRIVVALSLVGKTKAQAIISLGPLAPTAGPAEGFTNKLSFGAAESLESDLSNIPTTPLNPRITFTRVLPSSRRTVSVSTPRPSLVLGADIPSIHVHLCKPFLDSVQYWADDVAQLIDRTFGSAGGDTDTEPADSRDTSLIGSRFFAKSFRSRSSESGSAVTMGRSDAASEIVVKLAISEAAVRIILPRKDTVERPFIFFASDVDVLMEFKPEGKDETVLTVGIMDVSVADTSIGHMRIPLLSLTAPRSSLCSSKPLLKLRFTSLVIPETTVKESRVKLTLYGFTYRLVPNFDWVSDFALFCKTPPGTFESVLPSELTKISLKIMDGSIRAVAPPHSRAVVAYIGDLEFSTNIVGGSSEMAFHISVPALSLLLLDNASTETDPAESSGTHEPLGGALRWKTAGYTLLADISDLDMKFTSMTVKAFTDTRVVVNRAGLRLHLCADTLAVFTAFISDMGSALRPYEAEGPPKPKRTPTTISAPTASRRGVMSSVVEHAFQRAPEIGPPPDMINDDLPTNMDYLDESFGAAAGLRELRDDDLDEFDNEDLADFNHTLGNLPLQPGVISSVGGETIKILRSEGIHVVENHFNTLMPQSSTGMTEHGETTLRIIMHNCDLTIFLYDGYDWSKTRKAIEDEVKEMRRRLAKIRQLVASGQTQDPDIGEDTSTLLFNSVYIGLEQDVEGLEPGALIAAIDEELNDDLETASQSSWQSLRPVGEVKHRTPSTRVHGKRLARAKAPSIEFQFTGVDAEVDRYRPGESLVSRTLVTTRDVEILDHIKTSTWKKFLTELRSDSRGNVRETNSNMVRVELRSVQPVPGHQSEEVRLRVKILPLRLYVDQDALDFLKKFFSFKDPHAMESPESSSDEDIFFQVAEIFPVDLKLDYKPRRVDYRALRERQTIELMNFFHFDGAEMTLRHITLTGVTGWARLFDMLNNLWTPDVKATQLVDVISGVSPIRSVVNVGSGFADLVLLPIAQYKRDGRIVRGVQKGTTAFVKSTAMEAIKLGARLATGTQVILEQAEHVLGAQFKDPITAELVHTSSLAGYSATGLETSNEDDDDPSDLISKYAEQPVDVKEGVQSAYRSLQRNFHSAAQTILAVPMEVYERSGNEGAVRAVIRAVPIAVLKPMIGASEAVSKTLMGLQNTLDPEIRRENEAKYKKR